MKQRSPGQMTTVAQGRVYITLYISSLFQNMNFWEVNPKKQSNQNKALTLKKVFSLSAMILLQRLFKRLF